MFNVSAWLLDDTLKLATPLTNGAISGVAGLSTNVQSLELIFGKVKAYKTMVPIFWATLYSSLITIFL